MVRGLPVFEGMCACVYQGKHGVIPTERPMQTSPMKSSTEH